MTCKCRRFSPCNCNRAPLEGTVLVRVGTEILDLLKAGEVGPVVLVGVEQLANGTYDMILRTPPK